MYIEQDCTITHQGKSFEAGGAVITQDYLIAYPGANGELHDWHGNKIGTWKLISSRPAMFFGHRSWMADRYCYMRARVNGVQYSLRGFGEGMIAKGRRIKG